jgi:hypothetical protein
VNNLLFIRNVFSFKKYVYNAKINVKNSWFGW